MTTTTLETDHRLDSIRQSLNLVLAIGQVAAAALIFAGVTGNELFFNDRAAEPYFLPAGYVFSIWGFIYPASIVYGIYQALPKHRADPLLRRIGFATATAFFCIMMWSVVTVINPLLYTIPCFFGGLMGLIYAIYQISQHGSPVSRNFKLAVVWPLSVFAAWCTAGTIANVTTSLYAWGVRDFLLQEAVWGTIMLLAAGLLASLTVVVTKGNVPYGLTIIWALIGIAVAIVQRNQNPIVAVVAVLMAALVGVALQYARGKNLKTTA